jgi:hypothetical protein
METPMKLVASLLFLPVVALAAPSDHQAQMDQIFKMAKSRMLPMLEQSVPAMERTRNCLQAAESKDDFIECTTIMRDLQQKMMQNLAPQGAPHQKRPPKEEFDASKIEWNAETKAQMLTDITQSVEQGKATKGCLESSNSASEMESCMEKTGLSRDQN